MGNALTSEQFKQIAGDAINNVFSDQYRLVELENFVKWIKEAYPEVFKQYGCVIDAGYNDYE
jgi:hypothetical protein